MTSGFYVGFAGPFPTTGYFLPEPARKQSILLGRKPSPSPLSTLGRRIPTERQRASLHCRKFSRLRQRPRSSSQPKTKPASTHYGRLRWALMISTKNRSTSTYCDL